MNLTDKLPEMHGRLHYTARRGGEVIETYEKHNLIVDSGRKKLAAIMAGLDTGHIASVGIGTGETSAAVTDTGLENELLIPIKSATVDGLTAHFDFEIGKGTANGTNIKEFGLYFDDGTMFSHRVRESGKDLVKADDIIITGFWEVDF